MVSEQPVVGLERERPYVVTSRKWNVHHCCSKSILVKGVRWGGRGRAFQSESGEKTEIELFHLNDKEGTGTSLLEDVYLHLISQDL